MVKMRYLTRWCSLNLLTLILSVLIVVVSAFLCRQIISSSLSNQKNKIDYAELNNVKYGFFSVDEWKVQINSILAEEINKLYLSKENERELRKQIEVLLNTLIDSVYRKIRKGNEETPGGWFKQSLVDMLINPHDIKKGIPDYARAIMHEITKSKTQAQIKALLNKRIEEYLNETFSPQDTSRLSDIVRSTGSRDIEGARVALAAAISATQRLIERRAVLLIVLSVVLFALTGFSRQPLTPARFILLVLSLVLLLLAGVTTPMIDMEAKIARMTFVLLGHSVSFENQVLYFQSKSILNVFWLMIAHKDLQMKAVGVLLVTFSIFFPLLKIVSSLAYYFNFHDAREKRLIGFFVLKSGKWSMADVMVVAMFMAYIGFNGVITSQLDQLSAAGRELSLVATNGTSLQPGFYLFLTYALLALFFSGLLTRHASPH